MSEKMKQSRREFVKFTSAGLSGAAMAAVIGPAAEAQTRVAAADSPAGAAPTAAAAARVKQPIATAKTKMIRQLWFGFLNGVDKAEGERWYYRYHAPEFVRWYGPWLRRYETFSAIMPGGDAGRRFGAQLGKYTEMWWPSMEDYEEPGAVKNVRPYTPGNFPRGTSILSAMTIIPALPTEDFTETDPNPEQPIVRWLRVWAYPDGVSREEGDKWYLETHAPEIKKLDKLMRFVSYKTLDFQPYGAGGAFRTWHRVDEMWFPDMETWHKAFIDGPKLTAPAWAKQEPWVTMVSDFVRIKPDVDFLRGGNGAGP